MSGDLDPFEEYVGFWAYRMVTQGTAVLRRLFQSAGYDLTPEQWGVLAHLREKQGMNQSQLGDRVLKDRHNVTRILNVLEERGYIERRTDDADKRVFRIFLTQSGHAVQHKMTAIVVEHRQQMLSGLNKQELQRTQQILKQIVKNLEERPK